MIHLNGDHERGEILKYLSNSRYCLEKVNVSLLLVAVVKLFTAGQTQDWDIDVKIIDNN